MAVVTKLGTSGAPTAYFGAPSGGGGGSPSPSSGTVTGLSVLGVPGRKFTETAEAGSGEPVVFQDVILHGTLCERQVLT